MKTLSRLLTVLVVGLLTACQPEDSLNQAEDSQDTQNGSMSQQATGSRFMAYGDVVTIVYNPTNRFLTGESNGDATINKAWSTTTPWLNDAWLPWAKFRIVNPNNPASTAEVKTGDEVAFRCLHNNLYLTAESWDDDVSVNRTALGPWEKWRIYAPSNVTVGNSIFYSSVSYMGQVSLLSVWNKYLRPDAGNYAKAGGSFDPTLSVWSNTNAFTLSKQ